MDIEITLLTRRGSATMRRSRTIELRRLRTGLRFGRGTENEVQLPDIRVDLTAAALFPRGGAFFIQATGPSSLRVNGRSARSAIVAVGDEILIGPYRIELTDAPPGIDAALSVELVQPLGDALDRVTSQARIGLENAAISKRTAAWFGVVAIMVVGLLAPIMVYVFGLVPSWRAAEHQSGLATPIAQLWQPGELSNAHRFFAGDCTACHRTPFAQVRDDACTGCHSKVGTATLAASASEGAPARLATMRCAECHQEHRGSRGNVVTDARLCLDCHSSLAETMPRSRVRDIGGFPIGHPQFRVTLVADPASRRLHRLDLTSDPPPTDRPGIKFSHAAHLLAGGFPALGYRQMACADCHVAEPAGEGFLPITYRQQCERCHALTFERQELPWPNGKVPHGDDVAVAASVWNFYAGKALQGGILEDQPPAVTRRAPGATSPVRAATPNAEATAWVAEKSEAALRTVVLDDKRGCAYCHFGTGPAGAFELPSVLSAPVSASSQPPGRIVTPVVMRDRFLPHARFNHRQHAAVQCTACHDAPHVETSGTVMIPGIENCAGCHGAEQAALRIESTCTTCHQFHHELLGAMQRAAAPAR